MRDAIECVVLGVIVGLVLVLSATVGAAWQDERLRERPAACQEDDPCWNCATMGNQICGPREP